MTNQKHASRFFHTNMYMLEARRAARDSKPLALVALFLNIQSENIPFDVSTLGHKYFNSSCHNSVNYWWSLMHIAQHTKWVKINLDGRRERVRIWQSGFWFSAPIYKPRGLSCFYSHLLSELKHRKGCIIRISYVRYYLLGPTLEEPKITLHSVKLFSNRETKMLWVDTPLYNNAGYKLLSNGRIGDDFLSINRSCLVSWASKACKFDLSCHRICLIRQSIWT